MLFREKAFFSLVELVVVIAILMVITSLLSPALNSVIHKAYDTECKTQMRLLSNAQQVHTEDFNGFYTPLYHNHDGKRWWWIQNEEYLSYLNQTLSPCPTYVNENEGESHYNALTSYGLNNSYSSWRYHINTALRYNSLDKPSEVIQGADSVDIIFGNRTAHNWDNQGESAFRTLAFRHREFANAFYFDGHVSLQLDKANFYDSQDINNVIKYDLKLLETFTYQ